MKGRKAALVATLLAGLCDLGLINGVLGPRLVAQCRRHDEAVATQGVSAVVAPALAVNQEGQPIQPAQGPSVVAPPSILSAATSPAEHSDEQVQARAAKPNAPERATVQVPPVATTTAQTPVVGSHAVKTEPTVAGQAAPPVPSESATAQAVPPPVPDIRFATGRDDLSAEAKAELRRVVALAQHYPHYTLHLRGHADERGGRALNDRLSLWRAMRIRRYLQRQGHADLRVTTEGVGFAEPLDRSGSTEAWAKNRRVQFLWRPAVVLRK